MGKGIKMSYFYTQFKAGLTWAWQISATAFKCIFFSLYIPLSRHPPPLITPAIQPSYLTAIQSSTPSCQNNNWYSVNRYDWLIGRKMNLFLPKNSSEVESVEKKTQYFPLLSLLNIKKDLIQSSQNPCFLWSSSSTSLLSSSKCSLPSAGVTSPPSTKKGQRIKRKFFF